MILWVLLPTGISPFWDIQPSCHNLFFKGWCPLVSPITRDQFDQIKEALDDDSHLPEESYWSFRRMTLEAFYQQPLDEQIIRRDDRGALRDKFKVFAAITNPQLVKEINRTLSTLLNTS